MNARVTTSTQIKLMGFYALLELLSESLVMVSRIKNA